MKKLYLSGSLFLIIPIFGFFGCKKTVDPPTVDFSSVVNGYTVTFTPTVTNTASYLWDFGDTKTSTEANPVHTYTMSGDHIVTLTVTGEGGTQTKTYTVTIVPSVKELLTGGPNAASGKTWVLSTEYIPSKDGGGPIQPTMPLTTPSAESILTLFGLQDEYDNEFTFFNNGNYTINPKNGKILGAYVYCKANGISSTNPAPTIGLCAATYTAPSGLTWTLNTTDLVVDAITDPNTEVVPPVHANVTFTGKNWLSFSTEGFLGFWDYPTARKVIIKEISATKMKVAILLCGYGSGTDLNNFKYPTNLMHVTFITKVK